MLAAMAQLLQPINERLDGLEEEIRHTRVLIEGDVRKDIRTIAEQHGDIIAKLSVTAEVDSLKGRVSTLEGVAKSHTADLAELKKAQ